MCHLSETPWLAVAAASTSDGSAPPDLARIHQPSHHRHNTPRAPPFRPEHARLGPPRIVPAPIRMVEEVFGLAVQVISDPLTGTPLVLPLPRGAGATTSNDGDEQVQ